MQTDKLRLEIQLAEVGAAAQPVKPEKVETKLPIPKLQKNDENLDSMDDYLQRFERFLTTLAVDKTQWSFKLASTLTRKGLTVYVGMSADKAVDYKLLKEGLLKPLE